MNLIPFVSAAELIKELFFESIQMLSKFIESKHLIFKELHLFNKLFYHAFPDLFFLTHKLFQFDILFFQTDKNLFVLTQGSFKLLVLISEFFQ